MDPIRFGRGVRALRQRRGWRQADLARAAGVSRSVVARVEQGLGHRMAVDRLTAIASALGARVVVRLDYNGEQLDRLIDARHAGLVELVVRTLTAWGWLCASEVTFSVYGERGSVDVLAVHPGTTQLLVVEVKSAIGEVGNTLIALDRKARLGPRIARDRGWQTSAVGRLLVVADSSTTRRRLDAHRAIFDGEFPLRGWVVRQWLSAPTRSPGWSGLWIPSPDRQAVTTQRLRVRR